MRRDKMRRRVKKGFLGLIAGMLLLLGSAAAVMAADLEENLEPAAQFENRGEAFASASSSTVVQTKATTSSFTLSWGKITNAKYYNIYYRKSTSSTTDSLMMYSPSVVVNHLSANSKYYVSVKAYTSKGTLLASTGTFTCKTLPGQPGFRGKSTNHSTGKMTLYFKTPSNAAVEGYRVKYTNVKTKGNKTLTTSNLSYCYLPLKYSAYYKVEVNGYITLNGKKVYSAKRTIYLAQQPKIYKKSATKSTMTVRWNKVAGATNYSVYVSTSPNSGYKKVKTTTGTTYTKTGMKIGKYYYMYVVANRRVGSTTYKSPADYYSKFYIYYG